MTIPDSDNHPNRIATTERPLEVKWIRRFRFCFKLEFGQDPCHGSRRGKEGVLIKTRDRYHEAGYELVMRAEKSAIDPRIEPTLCQSSWTHSGLLSRFLIGVSLCPGANRLMFPTVLCGGER